MLEYIILPDLPLYRFFHNEKTIITFEFGVLKNRQALISSIYLLICHFVFFLDLLVFSARLSQTIQNMQE